MAKSDNLRKAKDAKNDEFYTKLEDIENEISTHKDYVKQFEGKTVFCNCDDPEQSNFFLFFKLHFKQLKMKKLITTHYNKDGSPSYKLEWEGETLNDDMVNLVKSPLKDNGDFQSEECIEILKEADIIVTNPPFSNQLPVTLINLCLKNNKDFILIGDENMIAYKNLFPLFKKSNIFLGYTKPKEFKQPDGTFKKFGNKVWFTNLKIDRIYEPIPLNKNYIGNEDKYPKYDNYDAIDVKSIKLIPKDYTGIMGVPITFLSSYCPNQFEILESCDRGPSPYKTKIYTKNDITNYNDINRGAALLINGKYKSMYHRILIKRKENKEHDS